MEVEEGPEGGGGVDDGDGEEAVGDEVEEEKDGGGGLDVYLAGHYAVLHKFLSNASVTPQKGLDQDSNQNQNEDEDGTHEASHSRDNLPHPPSENHVFTTLIGPSLVALERAMGRILACSRRNLSVAVMLHTLQPLPSGYFQVTPHGVLLYVRIWIRDVCEPMSNELLYDGLLS